MNKLYSTFSILVFVLLLATTLIIVITPDNAYSENENRELAQKPELTLENILDGTFQENVVNYMSDQFPFRDNVIGLGTTIKKALGKDDVGGAYIGKDGYYFEKITNEDFNFEKLEKNLEFLASFSEKYPELNAKTMIVPVSGSILSDKLPSNAEMFDSDRAFELANEKLGDSFIDIRDALSDSCEDYIYYKTDHHWTTLGAYIAYTEFCNAAGIEPHSFEEFGFTEFSDEFYGTLYSKNLDFSASPDTVTIAENVNYESITVGENEIDLYYSEAIEIKDKYLVFFGDNYGEVKITTETKNGKHLLLLKDSFANSFVPLIMENYETITMIDQRYNKQFMGTVIEENNITDVLFLYGITGLKDATDLFRINA